MSVMRRFIPSDLEKKLRTDKTMQEPLKNSMIFC